MAGTSTRKRGGAEFSTRESRTKEPLSALLFISVNMNNDGSSSVGTWAKIETDQTRDICSQHAHNNGHGWHQQAQARWRRVLHQRKQNKRAVVCFIKDPLPPSWVRGSLRAWSSLCYRQWMIAAITPRVDESSPSICRTCITLARNTFSLVIGRSMLTRNKSGSLRMPAWSTVLPVNGEFGATCMAIKNLRATILITTSSRERTSQSFQT
jgi:hypothetical protein